MVRIHLQQGVGINGSATQRFTPVGGFISYLIQKLAWESFSLRPLASYFQVTNIAGPDTERYACGQANSIRVRFASRVERGEFETWAGWNEWSQNYF